MRLRNTPFQILLVGLFFYLVFAPFLSEFPYTYLIITGLLTFVLLSAIFTLHQSRVLKGISIITLGGALLPIWLNFFGLIPPVFTWIYVFLFLYLSSVICSLLLHFFASKKVTSNLIYAALCLYLLAGILWGVVYALMETHFSGSFQGWITDLPQTSDFRLHGFIYFSFTTLTTLGYGDIVPQTLRAAALCQAEAIAGQFFISVLIARLVGIHIAQRMKGEV